MNSGCSAMSGSEIRRRPMTRRILRLLIPHEVRSIAQPRAHDGSLVDGPLRDRAVGGFQLNTRRNERLFEETSFHKDRSVRMNDLAIAVGLPGCVHVA